jgi:hypothetical protein
MGGGALIGIWALIRRIWYMIKTKNILFNEDLLLCIRVSNYCIWICVICNSTSSMQHISFNYKHLGFFLYPCIYKKWWPCNFVFLKCVVFFFWIRVLLFIWELYTRYNFFLLITLKQIYQSSYKMNYCIWHSNSINGLFL